MLSEGEKIRSKNRAPLRRLTSFSGLGDNPAHDGVAGTSRPILSRAAGPAVHLVQGSDEETARGERPVRPLHLSQMRFPAHDEEGP